MTYRNPPPPEVGARFTKRGGELRINGRPYRKVVYEVRAVVDPQEDEEYGWIYEMVFRFWSPRKGYCYMLVNSLALGMNMYIPVRKRPSLTNSG